METEIPVDDIAVETDAGGWVLVQSKNSLTNQTALSSELGKTCDEFARVWLLTISGDASRGWDRPLSIGKDAMLIAVGPGTSAPIKTHLPAALAKLRTGSIGALSGQQSDALNSFRKLMRAAFDARGAASTLNIDDVLKFIHVIEYNFGGPDRGLAEVALSTALEEPTQSPAALNVIEREFEKMMTARTGTDLPALRNVLAAAGTPLSSATGQKVDLKASVQEILEGQRDVIRAMSGNAGENPILTKEAGRRLRELRQGRFAAGFDAKGLCYSLIKAVDGGELTAASPNVRQSVLAWCSRVLASIDYAAAEVALSKAQEFGTTDETIIAEAFLEVFSPAPGKPAALAKLAPLNTPESLAASFIVASHGNDDAAGLKWLHDTALKLDRFHPDGKYRILGAHLATNDWPSALAVVDSLSISDFAETPALLMLAGQALLGKAVHPDLRHMLQLPLTQDMGDFPLSDDAEAMVSRNNAIGYYKRAQAAFEGLGAAQAAAMASDRALWLELRDPALAKNARERLQASMSDQKIRLRRIPLALAFGLDIKLQAVERDIERATALSGGKSLDAAIARFAVALRRKAPEVVDYIDKHRTQLIEYYHPDYVDAIAVEALTKAGRLDDARTRLSALEARGIEPAALATLRNLVDRANGADVLSLREAEYRERQTVPALLNLVDELRIAREFPKLAEFAEKLFEEVKDIPTAETYTSALYEINADEKIATFAGAHPEFVDASDTIGTTVSWAYYRLGRLRESKAILDKLRAGRDAQNDRYLSMNIAIASGDWSSLNSFVESEWQSRADREPVELLRAGALAQRIGAKSRSQELVREAAARANGDAEILVNSYSIASSAGWENEPEIHGWLERAIAASGEDGPVRRMDLKELVDLQPDWDRKMDTTWDLLLQGEIPMFIAGRAANRTILDIFLRTALRNLGEGDVRRRSLILAFGGTRPIRRFTGKRLAIDFTSLLTFALTGTVRRVLAWADSVVIGHSTLGWLFEERDKLAFHQPSQVRRARDVKQLIDAGQVHRFEGTRASQALEQEVGDDIGRYLVAAQTVDEQDKSQKVVVRPFPLHKPGSLLEENADVSGLETHFAGVGDVLAALKLNGHLTDAEDTNAQAYLRIHEFPWPHTPTVEPGATLYLDDVALSFLQHLGLLSRLTQAGFKVFVSASEVDRANELVSYDASGAAAQHLVEDLQAALRDGIASGKVMLGPMLPGEGDDLHDSHPTRLLIANPTGIDALVIDDRFVNKHGTATDRPIATSIEVLATMAADNSFTLGEMTQAVTRIRQAGMLFVPFRAGELEALLNTAPVVGGRVQETAELRAIRESIVRVRMTDALQLPGESAWLDDLTRECASAIRAQWKNILPDETARARSSWILDLFDARGWAHRSVTPGLGGIERYRAQISMLLLLQTAEASARQRYWDWLEGAALASFREEQPESYDELLKTVERIIDQEVAKALDGGNDAEQP